MQTAYVGQPRAQAVGSNPSFAQRAAQDPAWDLDNDSYDDELYTSDKPVRSQQQDPRSQPPYKQNTRAHRVREPQAALHVPKPRNYRPDPDNSSPERDPPSSFDRRPQNASADYAPPVSGSGQPRKSSIPDRSPLQKLQGRLDGLSKDEKRARMEQAEDKARQRRGGPQDAYPVEDRRVTSNPVSATNESTSRRVVTDPSLQLASARGPRPISGMYDASAESQENVRRQRSNRQARGNGRPISQDLDSPTAVGFASATSGLAIQDNNERRRQNSPRQSQEVNRSTSNRLQKRTAPQLQAAEAHNASRPDQQYAPNRAYDQHRRQQLPPSKVDGDFTGSRPQGNQQARRQSTDGPLGQGDRVPQPRHNPQRVVSMPPMTQSEWRSAGVAKLELEDLALGDRGIRTNDPSAGNRLSANYDGATSDRPSGYKPELFVNCGPLLRYTGLRRDKRPSRQGHLVEREIWRGSILLVTADARSSYSTPPTLKLFAQPMELLAPLPATHDNKDLPSDYVDPIAGEVRSSRTGETLFVRPIEALPEAVDVSQDESDNGLFERYRSSTNNSRLKGQDGKKVGKYRTVRGARLHAERGMTFWRFGIEVELGISQARIAYRINNGPAIGFWVPARGSSMNIMFHSCNGFSLSVNPDTLSGPDPLWRDVLNSHAMRPFHVMLGGGDQIYNDRVTRDSELFQEWLQIKNPERKHHAELTQAMRSELEASYLNHYVTWFSRGMFSQANRQIPMVNLWDDHDIIDGFGSYPDHFMRSKVFTGLGNIAFKYYMLFQHQAVPAETFHDEPSWILGASPGPYINHHSRNLFMFLGRRVAFLGLDCRTERRRDEILSQGTYDQIFNRCRAELIQGETKHLIVMLTVPIAYPRLNFLENILTSRAMDPIKAIGRTGALGGFVNKFDGGVEILDDLDDHWTAKHHKQERNWFIQELQELAAEKSIRITILGGDVHLGAIGQFYSRKAFGIPKDRDHRYMPNVVSSAIVNTPPPVMMSDILNRRNKVHHLDDETDEDMIPMFSHDVDGKSRKNKTLLPRRNYCTIREYIPGSTPPQSPVDEEPPLHKRYAGNADDERRYPPGSMGRSRSLTRDNFSPRNLIRRLSGSRSRNHPSEDDGQNEDDHAEPERRRFSFTGRSGTRDIDDDELYFRQEMTAANTRANANTTPTQESARPVNTFHRRVSDPSPRYSSGKRAAEDENDDDDESGHINLEGGLDVCLNMEVNQQDPSGITMPYRLLIPALFYDGPQDANLTRFRSRRASLMERMRSLRSSKRDSGNSYDGNESERSYSPDHEESARLDENQNSRHRPLHPDDRLQFADSQVHHGGPILEDSRRDSRLAGIEAASNKRLSSDVNRQPSQRANADPDRTRLAATAPVQGEEEFYNADNTYDDGPRKKVGFLGSLKRRFSSRRKQEEEYYSDDPDEHSFSASDDAVVDDGASRPPDNARPGQYRPPNEPVFRNDGRLPPQNAGRSNFQQPQDQIRPQPGRSASGPQTRGFAGTLNRWSDRLEERVARNQRNRRSMPEEGWDRQRAHAPDQRPHSMGPREMDDGASDLPSEADSYGAPPTRARRSSKAEQFLGLDQAHPSRSRDRGGHGSRERYNSADDDQYDDRYSDERPEQRRSWQIWKR